jgi:hypothetical protein
MCVRCQAVEAPDPLGLCPACVIQTRVEVTEGLHRIGDYLRAWADFERWLAERDAAYE